MDRFNPHIPPKSQFFRKFKFLYVRELFVHTRYEVRTVGDAAHCCLLRDSPFGAIDGLLRKPIRTYRDFCSLHRHNGLRLGKKRAFVARRLSENDSTKGEHP